MLTSYLCSTTSTSTRSYDFSLLCYAQLSRSPRRVPQRPLAFSVVRISCYQHHLSYSGCEHSGSPLQILPPHNQKGTLHSSQPKVHTVMIFMIISMMSFMMNFMMTIMMILMMIFMMIIMMIFMMITMMN